MEARREMIESNKWIHEANKERMKQTKKELNKQRYQWGINKSLSKISRGKWGNFPNIWRKGPLGPYHVQSSKTLENARKLLFALVKL